MGRKTRKSASVRKAPLHFAESPINIQNNIPSLVLCALNPPTAKSKKIDEFADLSWVSPQFANQCCASEHKKRGRGKKNVSAMRVRHNSKRDQTNNSLISHSIHIGKKCKYKPLPFLGIELPTVSPAEDIDVTTDLKDDDDVICRRKTVRKTRASQLKNKLKAIKRQSVSVDASIHSFHMSSKERMCRSDESSEEENRENDFTRIRPKSLRDKPRPRRILNDSISNNENCLPASPLSRCDGDHLVASPLRHCRMPASPSADYIIGLLPDRIPLEGNVQCSPSGCRRSVRLYHKYIESLKFIRTTTPPRENKTDTVLAFDTPESEYGMSIKQKQMREYTKR